MGSRNIDSYGFQTKSLDSYRANLKAAVRGLWSGVLNYMDFFDQMYTTIANGFPTAWTEAGTSADEMTVDEKVRLQQEILNEARFIDGFATYIEQHNKANGGKLKDLATRTNYWVAAYTRIRELAKTYLHNDPRQRWTLGKAEHCEDCKKLDGKVKRASYWREHLQPKDWKLACRQACKCTLEETTEPVSKGPLPGGF